MTDREPGDLAAAVDGVIDGLPGVERAPRDDALELRRGRRLFAIVRRDRIDVHLDAAVAAAARRTPDVEPSSEGAGWISFGPPVLDRYAVDRARAWIEAAHRRAAVDA